MIGRNSHSRVVCRTGIAVSRNTWVAWNVAWMVRMAGRLSLIVGIVQVAWIWGLSCRIASWARHVRFFSWLRANAPKSSKSWTSLIVVVITNRLSVSVDASIVVRVRIQVVVIVVVRIVVIVVRVVSMVMVSNICLTKLIKNWSGSFGVNSRYLSHYLAIVRMVAIIKFSSLSLLRWTYLRGATSFVIMIVVPVLSSSCLVCWTPSRVAHCTILLIVSHSIFFQ